MTANETTPRFDQYLAQIESRERKKRRRYQIAAAGAILLLGAGATWYFVQPDQSGPLRQYEASRLTYSMVQNLFDERNDQIVVAHPAIGFDTIYSPEDYLSLRGLLDQLESMSPGEEENSGESLDVPPTFAVDIAGPREVGSTLNFTIENYDENMTYMLDFGNGYRKEVERSFSYVYRTTGQFRLRLIATNAQGSSSIYNKSLSISRSTDNLPIVEQPAAAPVPEEVAEETPAASGNTAESESAGLIAMRGVNTSAPRIISTPIAREVAPELPADAPTASSDMDPLIASEVEPSFPGGMVALGNFVRSNYRYPRAAQNGNVEGVVYVQFVVNANGSISNPRVIRGIGSGCDEEALRLVGMMPRWNPGKQSGRDVSVYHTIPITFRLVK